MDNLLKLIGEQILLLETSRTSLLYSFEETNKILAINITKSFTLAQQDVLEAFASRLARTADILVQKVIKPIHLYESEPNGTVRDMLLLAEKKGIIEDAEILFAIRLFRNEIAHDYLPQSQLKIANGCLQFTPTLLKNVDTAIKYAQKYLSKI